MFDVFYKNDPARGKGSSGLGLFIVRELMRKMGGDVTVESCISICKTSYAFVTTEKTFRLKISE